MTSRLPFVDLQAQRRRIGPRLDAALARVLAHGQFILGPEVKELETRLARFSGVKHCVTCANGTDALLLPLMAWGIGPGDAVLVPSFTFVASAEVVVLAGATPIFVDVARDSFNMTAESLALGVLAARESGLTPKVAMPVDLFGQPADFARLEPVSRKHGLRILSDAAQSYGGGQGNRRVGSLVAVTSTSFFPSKPLGAYGDGGAIFTDDDDLAEALKSIRMHGQGIDKYHNVRIGLNSRLDTLQAAVLIEKLAILEDEVAARDRIAGRYSQALADVCEVPQVAAGNASAWAQYTILVENRDGVAKVLDADGIPTAIYYPIPVHRQEGYRHFPIAKGGLPVSEELARLVLSLPMHPYLEPADQDRVIQAVRRAVGQQHPYRR
ncbi:MAG: DegT/DnrJ/EryC1/StrS aminotransferase family protein [Alphaproteobacteria bacterium]|nr:DegT/DnrJ/EryC1/StrS aminotransferase family protein [Alphaproteobacteria bacterium]